MNIHQRIVDQIVELLYEQDFVVVPGFGGFVVKSLPSRLSPAGNRLFPPSKEIGFNIQLRQNDGVLVSRLQEKMKCSQAEASSHTLDFSEYCKGILDSKRRLNLQGIGFFYLDFENNLHFEPQGGKNFLKDAFGLEALILKAVPEENKTESRKEIFIDRRPEPTTVEQIRRKRRKYFSTVPVVVLYSVILIVFFLLLNRQNKGTLLASVFGSSADAVYTPVFYPEMKLMEARSDMALNYVADANGIAEVELDKKVCLRVRVNEMNSVKTLHVTAGKDVIAANGNFEIVMGCFSVAGNAEKMVKTLRQNNLDAGISGRNQKGMQVVSIGGFGTKDSAVEQLQRIKAQYPHSWIRARR